MKGVKELLVFAAGLAIGSAGTYFLTKKKYEQIAQERVDSVKKTFSEYFDNDSSEDVSNEHNDKTLEDNKSKDIYDEYENELKTNGYVREDFSKMLQPKPVKKKEESIKIIKSTEAGVKREYDYVFLRYYSDQVLVYSDTDQIIEDIKNTISYEALNAFGRYPDEDEDTVYVQNDLNHTYYEITLDEDNYAEIQEQEQYSYY